MNSENKKEKALRPTSFLPRMGSGRSSAERFRTCDMPAFDGGLCSREAESCDRGCYQAVKLTIVFQHELTSSRARAQSGDPRNQNLGNITILHALRKDSEFPLLDFIPKQDLKFFANSPPIKTFSAMLLKLAVCATRLGRG